MNGNIFKLKIRKYKNVFITSHKDLDFDALGSMLGMYYFVKSFKKDCFLVIEEKRHELGVHKVIKQIKKTKDVKLFSYKKVKKLINKNSILIITDTRKKELIQSELLFENIKNKIFIDHHIEKNNVDEDNSEYIGNEEHSSACEIVAGFLKSTLVKIPSYVATTMLCGIKVDTADFNVKTSSNTYKAAHNLIKMGADNKEAQILLKQPLKNYIERQDLIARTEIIDEKIAISYGFPEKIYEREELAKVSDALLKFEKIETCFTIGRLSKNTVGVSVRSIGEISASKVMEKLGGGGDNHDAATQIKNTTILDTRDAILEIINNIKE